MSNKELPSGATVAGLTHANRLLHEAMLEVMGYTRQYKDRAMQETWHKINEAINILTANGAACPEGDPAPSFLPRPTEDLDTPEARELLAALKHTLALAEIVDAQRGYVLAGYTPMSDTDSRGTDYADSVSAVAARLHLEINPPKGRGE